MDSFLASGTGAQNGFWGSVVGGIGEGLGKVASDVLPVWAASQMGMESNPNPTDSVDNPLSGYSLGDLTGIETARADLQYSQFMDGPISVSSPQPNTVLAMGVVAVGLIILFKVM